MTRRAGIALGCMLVTPFVYALAPVVDLSTPAPTFHIQQSAPAKVKAQTVTHYVTSESVLRTFAMLKDEVKARQQLGNDIVGRSRLDEKREAAKLSPAGVFIVAVDAGHGGHDTGAKGPSGVLEKNVVLGIARQLAAKINAQPNMKAVMTRNGDYFVPLRQRLTLARKANADLMLAIHADASGNMTAAGASVYILSTRGATNEAVRLLAKRENVILDDFVLETLPDNSVMVKSALIDLAQTVTSRDSLRLGTNLLNQLNNVTTLHYRRVEGAPFVVLKSPDIPSALIETGYITNPQEEQLLASSGYQQKLAQAILQGVQVYRSKTR